MIEPPFSNGGLIHHLRLYANSHPQPMEPSKRHGWLSLRAPCHNRRVADAYSAAAGRSEARTALRLNCSPPPATSSQFRGAHFWCNFFLPPECQKSTPNPHPANTLSPKVPRGRASPSPKTPAIPAQRCQRRYAIPSRLKTGIFPTESSISAGHQVMSPLDTSCDSLKSV